MVIPQEYGQAAIAGGESSEKAAVDPVDPGVDREQTVAPTTAPAADGSMSVDKVEGAAAGSTKKRGRNEDDTAQEQASASADKEGSRKKKKQKARSGQGV